MSTPEQDAINAANAAAEKQAEDIWNELEAADSGATSEPEKTAAELQAIEDSPAWPEDENAPTPPQAEADPSDPWANATPAQIAERDRMQHELSEAREIARRNAGRARKLADLQKQAQARPTTAAAIERTQAAQAKLKEMEAEYPEIVTPISAALESMVESVKDLNSAEEERRNFAQAEVQDTLVEQEQIFTAAHPDAAKLLAEMGPDQFNMWMLDQPARIRAAYYRNESSLVDADAAIEVMSALKAHLGMTPAASAAPVFQQEPQQIPALTARRERQLQAMAAPANNRRTPTPSGVPKSAPTNQEIWDAIEAEEQAAQRRA